MRRIMTWVWALKRDLLTLWFALKHSGTPWYVRVLAALLAVYALSPIDLIPDFIPFLGYLDDLIIVPAGVWILLRILPDHVLADSRAKSSTSVLERKGQSLSIVGLVIILAFSVLACWEIWRWFAA
jgi:uncharacterized membrane protein YkvA (DUF1232 family)